MPKFKQYEKFVNAAAEKHGVDPNLIWAVMTIESNGNPKADSGAAKGLMQLTDSTFKEMGFKIDQIFDPKTNIEAGTRYLKRSLNAHNDDTRKAAIGYHAGIGDVDTVLRNPRGNPLSFNYGNKVTKEFDNINKALSDKELTWDNVTSDKRWEELDWKERNRVRINYMNQTLIPKAKELGLSVNRINKIQNNFLEKTGKDLGKVELGLEKPQGIKPQEDVSFGKVVDEGFTKVSDAVKKMVNSASLPIGGSIAGRTAQVFKSVTNTANGVLYDVTIPGEDVDTPQKLITNFVTGVGKLAVGLPEFYAMVATEPVATAKELGKWGIEVTKETHDVILYGALETSGMLEEARTEDPEGVKRLEDNWNRFKENPTEPLLLFMGAKGLVKGGVSAAIAVTGAVKGAPKPPPMEFVKRLPGAEEPKLLGAGEPQVRPMGGQVMGENVAPTKYLVKPDGEIVPASRGQLLEPGTLQPKLLDKPKPIDIVITDNVLPQVIHKALKDHRTAPDVLDVMKNEWKNAHDVLGKRDPAIQRNIELIEEFKYRSQRGENYGGETPSRFADWLSGDEGSIRLPGRREIVELFNEKDKAFFAAYCGREPLKEPMSEGQIRRSAQRIGLNPDEAYRRLVQEPVKLDQTTKATLETPEATESFARLYPDRVISEKVTKPIFNTIVKMRNKMPEGIRRAFSSRFAAIKGVKERWDKAEQRKAELQQETDAITSDIVRRVKTSEDMTAMDRVLRGHPADFSDKSLYQVAENAKSKYREMAHRWAAERETLGLPIIEEWLSGDKFWYPHIYLPKLRSVTVAGKSFWRRGSAKVSREELGSTKPIVARRWHVTDGKGVIKDGKRLAVFDTQAEAQAFFDARSGFKVRYRLKGEGGKLIEETFKTKKDRSVFIDAKLPDVKIVDTINPPPGLKVLEPMDLDGLIGLGLIEHPVLNIKRGARQQAGLIGKTGFLSDIADIEGVLSKDPIPGYDFKLEDYGFPLDEALVKNNPGIAKLKNEYINNSLAKDLMATLGKDNSLASQIFYTLENWMKGWVTHRNPFRYGKQIIENEIQSFMNDTGIWANKKAQYENTLDAFNGFWLKKPSETWKLFVENGLTRDMFLEAEIPKETLAVMEEAALLGKDSPTPTSYINRLRLWADKNPTAQRLAIADNIARLVYSFEDVVYKYHHFKSLLERGTSPTEAARIVKGGFFFTERPPRFVEALRPIPFMPQVMYNYAKTYGFMLKEKPASTLLKLGTVKVLGDMLKQSMNNARGITKEDKQRMGRFGIKPTEIVLPVSDAQGRNMKWDFGWLLPFQDLMDLPSRDYLDEPLRRNVLRLSPMSVKPLLSVLNIGRFGEQIYDPAEPPEVKNQKIARSIRLGYTPYGSVWLKWAKNIDKGESNTESMWEKMVLEPLIGNITHFTVAGQIEKESVWQNSEVNKINKKEFSWKARLQQGNISQEKFDREMKVIERRRQLLWDRHLKTVGEDK